MLQVLFVVVLFETMCIVNGDIYINTIEYN